MKFVANETAYAKRCLKKGFIEKNKPYWSVFRVVRYLNRICGIDDIDELFSNASEYIESKRDVGKTCERFELTENMIVEMLKKDYEYNELESVSISSNEIKAIMNNDYPYSWRKVLFTMLVQCKVKNVIYNSTYMRVSHDWAEICKDAHVHLSNEKRLEMFSKFLEDGYIEIPNGGSGTKYIYLNYVDEEPQDELIVVKDFYNIDIYLDCYVKGGRLIHCQECGEVVHVIKKNDYSTKYCDDCKKKKALEKQKRYDDKKRGK